LTLVACRLPLDARRLPLVAWYLKKMAHACSSVLKKNGARPPQSVDRFGLMASSRVKL
tara:strand:+ start:1422 stop:1595 length:174 start_codon:yes stop_codon:yes gene_type:complete